MTLLACQENEIQESEIPVTQEGISAYLNDLDQEYAENNPVIEIELATIDELNSTLIKHGLEPYGQEDFTPEEWEFLNSEETKAEIRCQGRTAVRIGDWSRNRRFSSLDLVMASNFLNAFGGSFLIDSFMCPGGAPGTCVDPRARNFAQFSWFWRGTGPANPGGTAGLFGWRLLDIRDIDTARRVLLGLEQCG